VRRGLEIRSLGKSCLGMDVCKGDLAERAN